MHNDGAVLISRGRLFHASGAAMEKPRSPNFILVRGRTMFRLFVERGRHPDPLPERQDQIDNEEHHRAVLYVSEEQLVCYSR